MRDFLWELADFICYLWWYVLFWFLFGAVLGYYL